MLSSKYNSIISANAGRKPAIVEKYDKYGWVDLKLHSNLVCFNGHKSNPGENNVKISKKKQKEINYEY